MNNRIEVNPDILTGKPVIAGTRIPVYLILNLLASGYSYDRIIEAYPGLTREDITATLSYAEQRMGTKKYTCWNRWGHRRHDLFPG